MAKLEEGFIKRWLSRNDRLIHYWANRFRSYDVFDYNELYQIAYLGALHGLNSYDPDRRSKSGSPIDVASHVGVHIRKELQVAVGLLKSPTKRTFLHVSQSKGIYYDSLDQLTYKTTEDDLAEVLPELIIEDKDILEEVEGRDLVEEFLKFLTPLQTDCLSYKYGLTNTIDETHKPFVDVIANLALIKLRRLQPTVDL
jgi:hypothetical protein